MNLAYKYPIIFWNTANLIIDSGSDPTELDDEDLDEEEMIIQDLMVEEGASVVNYGKIASAIGRMQERGIQVHPPNINKSKYTFTPEVETNSIMYGIKGIVRVGDTVVDNIIANRPYLSVQDFLDKVKVNKPQMVNLIKSGAFDNFSPRREIMEEYVLSISDTKKVLNLRNANMLINAGLIPDELDFERKVFNFNKYIRKFKKDKELVLDATAMVFYAQHFDMDKLRQYEGGYSILAAEWKKTYDKYMDNIRQYIKKNHDKLLDTLNNKIIQDVWNKYASGSDAKWSMDSVCFYQDSHELDNADFERYGIVDFFDLPNSPEVDYRFTTKSGHEVTMYKIEKIAGTVIDRDKLKNLITLLTTRGVVSVRAYGVMPYYDKQISEIQPDGRKKIIEKSMFTRGNMIIVQGYKRDEATFLAKKYKNTPSHHFVQITEVGDDGSLTIEERVID